MFLKHPGTYVEAALVKGYGYLVVPAGANLDAYILSDYYPELGAGCIPALSATCPRDFSTV